MKQMKERGFPATIDKTKRVFLVLGFTEDGYIAGAVEAADFDALLVALGFDKDKWVKRTTSSDKSIEIIDTFGRTFLIKEFLTK